MELELEIKAEITLKLTVEEATYLRDITQNSPEPDGVVESKEEYTIRGLFFNNMKSALERAGMD